MWSYAVPALVSALWVRRGSLGLAANAPLHVLPLQHVQTCPRARTHQLLCVAGSAQTYTLIHAGT